MVHGVDFKCHHLLYCLKLLASGLCEINTIRVFSTINYSSSQSILVLASTSSSLPITKAYKYDLIYEDMERIHFYTIIMCTEMTYGKPELKRIRLNKN